MGDVYPVTLPRSTFTGETATPDVKRYTSKRAALAQLRADPRSKPVGWNAGVYNRRVNADA